MNCPHCGSAKTEVCCTKKNQWLKIRYRRCLVCKEKFQTEEKIRIARKKPAATKS